MKIKYLKKKKYSVNEIKYKFCAYTVVDVFSDEGGLSLAWVICASERNDACGSTQSGGGF